MKLILSAILTFALVIIFNCILRLHKRQDNLTRTVRRILWIGSSIIAFNLWSLLSLSEWWVEIAYICYFIATDWLLYYLLRFSLEYIGRRFEDYVKRPLIEWCSVLIRCLSQWIAYGDICLVWKKSIFLVEKNSLSW